MYSDSLCENFILKIEMDFYMIVQFKWKEGMNK